MRRTSAIRFENISDLLESLGGIPASRVRLIPSPGTATKRDLLRYHDRGRRLYELVESTLVEKPMGSPESFVAMELAFALRLHLSAHDAGFLYGADALIEIMPHLVRGPDLSFISWTKGSERTVPGDPISHLVPDLAVEILSPRNTRAEMKRKLGEYFDGGVRLVWIIDPRSRTAEVHTGSSRGKVIAEDGSLDGADVLPGFRIKLAKLFERLEKPKSRRKKRK